jgi:hypothetical protein
MGDVIICMGALGEFVDHLGLDYRRTARASAAFLRASNPLVADAEPAGDDATGVLHTTDQILPVQILGVPPILGQKGARIWSGPVLAGSRLNETICTSFSIPAGRSPKLSRLAKWAAISGHIVVQ